MKISPDLLAGLPAAPSAARIYCRRYLAWAGLALLSPLFLCHCGSLNKDPYAPPSPLADTVARNWERQLSDPALLDDPRWQNKPDRDDLVRRLMFLCDYRFGKYERGLVTGRAVRDSVVDEIIFGLSTATTFVSNAATSKILGAVGGGFTFTRNNYEKNFYQNQTMPVLIRKMHALRLEKSNQINERLDLDTQHYSVYSAAIDILDYYQRGTVYGALQAISDDTAIQEFQLNGGKVTPPPAAETPPERYGRFKLDEIRSSSGVVVKPWTPPEEIDIHAPTFNPELRTRNKRLKEAFEFLSPDEATAIIKRQVPDYDPTNANPRSDLAARILVEAGHTVVAGEEPVATLAALRASAQTDEALKKLEEAYSKFITLPALPEAGHQ